LSIDTTHRPLIYNEVLGQTKTIIILRQIVIDGTGFHQSYVLAGPWGSGKTTIARILARALLCSAPKKGNPCDQCKSCRSILDHGTSEDFCEFDAATNSGKDDIKKLTEEAEFATFSGQRRIYVVDECFTDDTVLLVRGPEDVPTPMLLREIVDAKWDGEVLSYDPIEDHIVWVRVTDWFDVGEREVVRLTFDDGSEITTTLNQKLYTKNRGWVSVSDLDEEDDVVASL